MTTFYFQPGPAGSGKTYQLAHWSIGRASANEKVLITQPTKELIRATANRIRALDPNIKVTTIYQRRANERVTARVLDHMKQAAPHHGEVLLITHETLKRLPENMRQFWHMVCDEVPSVLEHIDLRIAKTHHIVTDYIDASEQIGDGLIALQVADRGALEAVQVNETKDQNVGSFERLVSVLLSGDHVVFISKKQWDDLTTNPAHTGHVDFFSVLTADFVKGYMSTTFMGANIEETELFVLWSATQDINWLPHPDMSNLLRYVKHQNGKRLTIGYLFDGKLSKRFLEQEDDEGLTMFDQVAKFVAQYFAGTTFLWQANKDAMPAAFDFADRLPGVAHGLDKDEWKSVHNVALLSAMNRKSAAYGFLKSLGISNEQAQATLSYQNDYQAMMRCSLRDPNAIAPVRVIVGSKEGAEWIAAKFDGCTVEPLEHSMGEPSKAGRPEGTTRGGKTASERGLEHRKRQKEAREALARQRAQNN
jgi:hypothetical protein